VRYQIFYITLHWSRQGHIKVNKLSCGRGYMRQLTIQNST